MVALASDLDFAGSRFLTGLTAVFVARLRQALAWQVCTFVLLSCHRYFSFGRQSLNLAVGSTPVVTAHSHQNYEFDSPSSLVASEIDPED
jgi:hypothetical protein